MDRASVDTGWLTQTVTVAVSAVIPEHSAQQNANMVVVNQHKDGK